MKIVLSGGTGFLGRHLWSQLASQGHEVVVLTRGAPARTAIGRTVTWDPMNPGQPGVWAAELDGADAVINLAGDSIADKRWSEARKEALRQSRILSTRQLIAAMRAAGKRPPVFISGSAVGYYGTAGDETMDESFPPGSDFLATACVDWEAEARAAEAFGCRVVLLRTGVVLDRDGGALKKMIVPFRYFVGGPIATGRQYISWIHVGDWVAMVEWAVGRASLSGPLNATAPNPVTNEEFSRALGRALGRPSAMRVPRLALRLLLGEMADVALVNGQRVIPRRALEGGFAFRTPGIDDAMAMIR